MIRLKILQYDFGPMGCGMKTNFIDAWKKFFILEEQVKRLRFFIMGSVSKCLSLATDLYLILKRDLTNFSSPNQQIAMHFCLTVKY
jgi:hypothetical protein